MYWHKVHPARKNLTFVSFNDTIIIVGRCYFIERQDLKFCHKALNF
jgi:hypothetical protein